jgi:RNA polymerase sigma-B factor
MLELLEEYRRTRDMVVRDEIVLENMDLVEQIAQRFRYSGEPVEDLVQEGVIGLIHAVELFDLKRGVKFATYASHVITGAIQHYLRDRGKLIREPGWLHDLSQKVNKASFQLAQQLGRDPSVAELARELDLSEETVNYVMSTRDVFHVTSLEQPMGEDGEDSWTLDTDRLLSLEQPSPMISIEDRLALEAAVGCLRGVEQQIIRDFFFENLTQTEIAENLGYSRSHVSHLMNQALKQLRHLLTAADTAAC